MERYTELSVKQFVDTSSDIRWCLYPDCGYAICIKNKEKDKKEEKTKGGRGVAVGRASSSIMKLTPGKNVECGQGHGFCWNCMKDPHEPCSCELWEKWKEVILGNMSEEDKSRVAHEAQANAHWIIRNTKPCPNCKAPIQKNEGCNHMTCNKCRHDFCWVCLDPWRLHSHRTGGYFTCNRWNAQAKANRDVEKARSTMEKDYVVKAKSDLKKQKEKYEHHHSRYNNHLQSLDIEMKLLQDSQAKLREMERLGQALDKKVAAVRAQALMENEENVTEEFADEACRSFPHLKGNFLDDIFRSLLHARRILAASYCIGYFLPEDKTHEIQEHEKLQGRLEAAVETLSQMVNREYLLTPQYKMKEVARDVDTLCEGYIVAMQQVATIAGRIVTGIEEAERREERERERQRQRQAQEAPPIMDDIFFLNFLQMFDGNGRLHIFVPQTTPTRGQ